MLIGIMVIISAIALFLVVPLIIIKLYYKPESYSVPHRVFWTLVTVFTWPLVPLIMVTRRNSHHLLAAFWISFLAFAVSLSYWLVLHVHEVIAFGQQYFLY